MGMVSNINNVQFPVQGNFRGKKMKICFNYDTSKKYDAICIRDDAEEPGKMLFSFTHPMTGKTEYVLSTECMYSPVAEKPDN